MGLARRQASLLFQLRSGHIGPNQHLFHIHKSDTPVCPNCQGITVESVKHFLIDCPLYRHERHVLNTKLRRNAGSISFFLSSPVVVLPVLKFVHATGCFKTHFGKDLKDKIPTRAQRNAEPHKAYESLKKNHHRCRAKVQTQTQVLIQPKASTSPPPPPLYSFSHSFHLTCLHPFT